MLLDMYRHKYIRLSHLSFNTAFLDGSFIDRRLMLLLWKLTLSIELDDFDLLWLRATGTPWYCDEALYRIVLLIFSYPFSATIP